MTSASVITSVPTSVTSVVVKVKGTSVVVSGSPPSGSPPSGSLLGGNIGGKNGCGDSVVVSACVPRLLKLH